MFPLGGDARAAVRCATATGVNSATAQAPNTSPMATRRTILVPLSSIRCFICACSSRSTSTESGDLEHALHDRCVRIAHEPVGAFLQRDGPLLRSDPRGTRELVHTRADEVGVVDVRLV